MHRARSLSRRHLLQSGMAIGAAATLPGWFLEQVLAEPAAAQPKSANDKPGIGLVGCGGRGQSVIKEAAKFGKVVAVCDVDATHLETAALDYPDAAQTGDFRELIARKDVDIVVTATPDHWHTLVNLHALKNGKDVYSEKPLTLTIDEGKHLRDAVKQSGRVLQTGSQQRSDPQFRLVAELVRNGRLGKLNRVTTFVPAGWNKGPFKSKEPPKGLNWDMWLGQAPTVPFLPERCHLSFRFWYD